MTATEGSESGIMSLLYCMESDLPETPITSLIKGFYNSFLHDLKNHPLFLFKNVQSLTLLLNRRPFIMSVQDNARFDFIVVGGGTAGNVVAGRLAENPNAKILVVEAGVANSKDIEEIRTPSNAMELRDSQYDWAYKSTIVKRDDYERIKKPNTRGKALCGSSSLNYFTWVPGSKGTFDMWEEYGGKEWTWDPLLPYLRKSVTYHDD
ncbi:unnamed protein product [Penicillium egyptiacum]|uniref:Glucose-methanol-choline oxidoreductase N-terminal domain-containing protein n=1 Tax=Penicillium egyptiacum TaxID=1303716 RepID=A0A9W4KCE5_9EURO|nr:unnamed protein product [Penicillium egyptiacum]